ncbi:hypothetical protein MJT46_011930 [Ovis ammon polii x Ovis aries]|nr:hypothetical protein MJT46_011930 [Ovis ammon polii x Ovis aries]
MFRMDTLRSRQAQVLTDRSPSMRSMFRTVVKVLVSLHLAHLPSHRSPVRKTSPPSLALSKSESSIMLLLKGSLFKGALLSPQVDSDLSEVLDLITPPGYASDENSGSSFPVVNLRRGRIKESVVAFPFFSDFDFLFLLCVSENGFEFGCFKAEQITVIQMNESLNLT